MGVQMHYVHVAPSRDTPLGGALGGASGHRAVQGDPSGPDHPRSDDNMHIPNAIDMRTLWIYVWMVTIPDKGAITVATAFLPGVYLDLRTPVFPVILRSDNGKEFVAGVTRELNSMMGTAQIFDTAYIPAAQPSSREELAQADGGRAAVLLAGPPGHLGCEATNHALGVEREPQEGFERHDPLPGCDWVHSTESGCVHD